MLNPKYVLEFSKWGKSDDQTSFLKFLNRQAQPFKKMNVISALSLNNGNLNIK